MQIMAVTATASINFVFSFKVLTLCADSWF
jgi:hypothetical protein